MCFVYIKRCNNFKAIPDHCEAASELFRNIRSSPGVICTYTMDNNTNTTIHYGLQRNGSDNSDPPDISVEEFMSKIYISIGTFGMCGNLSVVMIILRYEGALFE